MTNVDRLSLAPDGQLGALIRSSASAGGESVSAWLIEAARMRLRNQVLGRTLTQWFSEDGYPSDEQVQAAEKLFDNANQAEAKANS